MLTTKADRNGVRIRQTETDQSSGDKPSERRKAKLWTYLTSEGSVSIVPGGATQTIIILGWRSRLHSAWCCWRQRRYWLQPNQGRAAGRAVRQRPAPKERRSVPLTTRRAAPGAGGCDDAATASEPSGLEPVRRPSGRYGALRLTRLTRTRRIRRCIRTGALLIVVGLMRLARAVRIRWQEHERRCALERELAQYSTPAQRCDLAATLDRYPDSITYELRDILARAGHRRL